MFGQSSSSAVSSPSTNSSSNVICTSSSWSSSITIAGEGVFVAADYGVGSKIEGGGTK